jgi:hypothetical protein
MAEELSVTRPGPVFQGFTELPSSSVVVLAPAIGGPPILTPKQYLYFYSADDWEAFTEEWVRALEHPYVLVTRMGGAGDRGADIAACLTEQGTNGEWHCYQCKHYEEALTPGDAYPEMVKIFAAAVQGHYALPQRYVFVAPKIGPTLTRLLANPATLKVEFFKAWDKPGKNKLGDNLEATTRAEVEKLARGTEFALFKAGDLDEVLKLHSKTRDHVRRFGTPLKSRPAVQQPPTDGTVVEVRYVQKLLDVYNEKYGWSMRTLQEARDNEKTGRHLGRQREAFYSAESLRVFARDSVPEGTYEAIESEIYSAVIEVHDSDFDNGYDRLNGILAAARTAQLGGNIFAPVITGPDRKGICHQLANADRLTWCEEPR